MAGIMARFEYVSDDGTTYKMRLDNSNSVAVGATVGATTLPVYPRGWRPRYILAESVAGKRRKVIVPDPTNGVWTGATATVGLEEAGSATAVTYTITARIGEARTSRSA